MPLNIYAELIKRPCVWCKRTPEAANGMGVDRRDNNFGTRCREIFRGVLRSVNLGGRKHDLGRVWMFIFGLCGRRGRESGNPWEN